MGNWQPIETAPCNIEVKIKTEKGFILNASYQPGFLNSEGEDAWGWCAIDDKYPDDWDDGICWESNSDMRPSDQPAYWKPITNPASNRLSE